MKDEIILLRQWLISATIPGKTPKEVALEVEILIEKTKEFLKAYQTESKEQK